MEEDLGQLCGLGVYKGCLDERKPSYACHNYYNDVSPMLCQTHFELCVTCIDDDYKKYLFSSLPIVFGGQVSKLEMFLKMDEGMVPMIPSPASDLIT